MGHNAPRGHTGQRVQEPGTYRCSGGSLQTYVPGDTFMECPSTGRPTDWVKTHEHHPGDSR